MEAQSATMAQHLAWGQTTLQTAQRLRTATLRAAKVQRTTLLHLQLLRGYLRLRLVSMRL